MIRWVLLIYPAEFRDRHGTEISEMISSSRQPVRDLADVAMHAARMRWEMTMATPLRHATNATLVASVFLLGYTLNDVQGGITEVHRHWWSTLSVALVALAAVARLAVELAATREGRPRVSRRHPDQRR